MTDLKNSSDINSNTIYMSALSEIKALLLKDIADNGLKSYHPSPNKLLLKNGEVTKKAERYNRRLLLEGKTTRVLDDTKIFNIDTGRFKNKPLDGRYTKKNRNPLTRVYKQGAIAGKNRINEVFASKKETKDFRYVMNPLPDVVFGEINVNWSDAVAGTLRSNDLLRQIVKDNKIKGNYRIIITVNQKTVRDNVYNVKPTNAWWDSVESQFRIDSDNYVWNNQNADLGDVVEEGDVVHFIFTKEKKLVKKFYEQSYLDAKVGHCVFTPILDWANDMVENAKGDSTKKKYKAVIAKIVGIKKDLTKKRCRKKETVGYLDKYKNGIPQSEIADLCEDLQIGICIEQPFESNKPFFKYSHQSPRKMFRFINTRINHVEYQKDKVVKLNEKSCFKQYDTEIIHDRKDLIKIRNKLEEEQVFFVYRKDAFGITGIQTLTKNYQLYSQYNETVNEFEKMFGLRWCAIDARKYPDLMGFINDGTHFNGTIDFINTSQFKEAKPRNGSQFKSNIPKNMRHIDMTKAYTQSDKCRWYDGFMLKITDFRKTDKYYDNGLYYIYDIDLNGCDKKFLLLNDKLGWFISENIYTSAELKALEELGGKFKVACGCWGIKDDFGFNKTMTEGVDEIVNIETGAVIKVPFYSKWAGMNCMQYENKNIWIKGDQLYLANFQTDSDIYISHYLTKDRKQVEEGRISYAKEKVMCKKHITAQITAYQRLTMLDQLLKMDYSQLVRVCVDGIYYWDHEYENKNDIMNKKDPLFGDKTKKMTFNNDPCTEYLSNLINKDGSSEAFGLDRAWECNAEPREHYKSELFDGAGGDGKTYGNIFIDKGFIDVCYVPHSNRLATAMQEQYQKEKNEYLHTSNHYRVTNEPFAFMFKDGVGAEALKHNVYVVDEASFLKEGTKEFMLNRLWGKIIFCGDLKCQIEPMEGKQMTPEGIEHIAVMSGKNYRFKTKMQLKACNFLRDVIINNKKSINFESLPYQIVNADYVKNNYDHKKDMILVSCGASKNQKESNYNNWWNNYLDDTCVKYKVKNNTRDYKNGDIVFDKIGKGVVTELRNGFTIHSIQGETYDGKIFIDMRKMRDLKMFYTAVSRARYESQIFLVKF